MTLPMNRRTGSQLSKTPSFFSVGIALCCVTIVSLIVTVAFTQELAAPMHFFPLSQGTYWVYQGKVAWFDQAKRKSAESKVTLKMSVGRVFQKEGILFAEIEGYPANLNFTTGEANPSHWILTETPKHEVFLRELDPNARLPLTESAGSAFDSFMAEDDLLLEWPMARGKKYCDAESARREDEMYCWVVESEGKKNLAAAAGPSATDAAVFTISYRTNPDDTEIELSPGIGIVAYHYYHHGTTAETNVKLTGFHPVSGKSASPGGAR